MSVSVLNTDSDLSGSTLVTAEGARTISGLFTFSRGATVPFAVAAGSTMVTNLDVDKLHGNQDTYFTNATNMASGTLAATRGGTGVSNNVASTLTISGAFGITLTVSGATSLTLPTSGTLATLAGSEALSNKTISASTLSGTISGTPTWGSSQAITLSTAAQPNVTSLGTLTSITVNGAADISGAVTLANSTVGNSTVTIGTGSKSGDTATYLKLLGSNSTTNWQISTNGIAVGGAFDITPSTAGGGSTFTTPVITLTTTTATLKFAAWTYNSDRTLKKNIRYFADADVNSIAVVRGLRPASFDYIDGPLSNLGFIAQDVQSVVPAAVAVNPSGLLGLKTEFLLPHVVYAMQTLDARVTALEAKLGA